MPYFTYALLSEEGYHYIGHTADLHARMVRHKLHTTHYTKKGTNWKVMYSKAFATRAEAMQHENG